jgi:hypothetical protein
MFGEIERFNQLLDTGGDTIGLTLMDEQLPRRVRTRISSSSVGGLAP